MMYSLYINKIPTLRSTVVTMLAARVLVLVLLIGVATSQTTLQSWDDNACSQSVIQDNFAGHGYMFSWEDPKIAHLELSWDEASEFCRQRCLDLVSLETKEENQFVSDHIVRGKQSFVWTSGHKCNYAGCDRPDLIPANVYGWLWAGSLVRIPPTTNRRDSGWSDTGGLGQPQPDNREQQQGGSEEDCLAVLNDLYGDGVKWHDVACNYRKPFVCEDNRGVWQQSAGIAHQSGGISSQIREQILQQLKQKDLGSVSHEGSEPQEGGTGNSSIPREDVSHQQQEGDMNGTIGKPPQQHLVEKPQQQETTDLGEANLSRCTEKHTDKHVGRKPQAHRNLYKFVEISDEKFKFESRRINRSKNMNRNILKMSDIPLPIDININ